MIRPLTSLRFVFAFMVFTSHLEFLDSEVSLIGWVYSFVFYEGYIGVSFFFILSGFILAYNYQDSLNSNKYSRRDFYRARIARIVPLHILTLLISIPLTVGLFSHNKIHWLIQFLTNLSLTQSFFPVQGVYYSFNAPSWSISNEMFFYLVFPFAISSIPKSKSKRIYFVTALILLIPLTTLIVPDRYYHQIFYINPFVRLADFILGIVLFNVYRKITQINFKINYNVFEIGSVLILFTFFIFHSSIPKVARYSFYYWIPMSLLILSFAFQNGILSKGLSNKFLIHMGEISFGFYMYHQLVIRYFEVFNKKYFHLEHSLLQTAIILCFTLALSHFSFKFFERPINRVLKNVQ